MDNSSNFVGLLCCIAWPTLVVVLFFARIMRKRKRKANLLERYGNEEIVGRILNKDIWQGETAEMLLDSLGKPDEVDQQVLKTKVKETWKYGKVGQGRYKLRIMLDNDVVIGWESKGK